MKNYVVIFVLSLLLNGCSERKAEMAMENATGEVGILFLGTQKSALEAWNVKMTIFAYNRPETNLQTEVFVTNLNEENVKVDWENENLAIITFHERDNSERKFKLLANKEITHFYEIKE